MPSDSASIGARGEIGYRGGLPWKKDEIPSADMRRFKELTSGEGKAVFMGRRTYESIGSKDLPERMNFVISRETRFRSLVEALLVADSLRHEKAYSDNSRGKYQKFETLREYPHIEAVENPERYNFIIGGHRLYEEALNNVDIGSKLYLTRVNAAFNADVFFSAVNWNLWRLNERRIIHESGKISIDLLTFERVNIAFTWGAYAPREFEFYPFNQGRGGDE